MTVYPPVETARRFAPEPVAQLPTAVKSTVIGLVAGLFVGGVELMVAAANRVVAIGFAAVVLFVVLILLTEFICPSGAFERDEGNRALRGVRGGTVLRAGSATPSPSYVLALVPSVAVLVAFVCLEHFPST